LIFLGGEAACGKPVLVLRMNVRQIQSRRFSKGTTDAGKLTAAELSMTGMK